MAGSWQLNKARVDELVRQQASRTPAAVAIQCGTRSLTYGQLWDGVESVKAGLRSLPPGPVGVLLPRGLHIGSAILGVLQSGRAMVPMDLQWPAERVAVASDAAKCCALIVEDPGKWLEADVGRPVLRLADMLKAQAMPTSPRNHSNSSPCEATGEGGRADEDIATILFTSGSTGKPKGVLLSHRYLYTLVSGIVQEHMQETGNSLPIMRPLAYFSPSWMPFIDSFYCPLVTGGVSTMWEPYEFNIGDLSKYAQEMGINWFVCVPVVLQGILDEAVAKPPPICDVGGAPCPVAQAKDFFKAGGKSYLFSYSGTEQGKCCCSWVSTLQDVEACTEADQAFFDLGRPRYEQKLCIVDEGGEVVKDIHKTGEIVVMGPGLFSGYLGATEGTFWPASKEVALEFGCKIGERVYRTKDLAKWHPKGGLRMTGRSDSMVKVRGLRIDLGEVSTVLQSAPGVKENVVVVCNDTLAAYVSPASACNVKALKEHCGKRLAKYMVPTVWKGMSTWPRLSNGKVDKKSLPPLIAERGPYVPPESEAEVDTADVWKQVLATKCIGEIGREDNLDEFGATSVDISLIVSRLRKLGYVLSIKQAYEAMQLKEFAKTLRKELKTDAEELTQPAWWFTFAQAMGVVFLLTLFGVLYSGEYMLIYLTFDKFGIPFNAVSTTLALSIVWCLHLWAMAASFILISQIPFMRIQPGTYAMYGKEHLVLWFYWRLFDRCVGEFSAGGMLGASLLSSTDGSVWTNRIYGMLGAEIGANTVIDVHTGLGYLLFPHLVTVGKGCSFNKGVKVRTFEFRDRRLIVKPVKIGDHVHVGAMSVIMPGAEVADNSVVAPRTVIPMCSTVAGCLVGSPPQIVVELPYTGAEAEPLKVSWPAPAGGRAGEPLLCGLLSGCPDQEVVFSSGARNTACFFGLFATTVLSSVSLIPSVAVAFRLYQILGLVGAILSLPLCSLISDMMLLMMVLIMKPLLVGKLKPGNLPMNSWAYFSFWLFRQLFASAQVVTMTLNKSPICLAWLNAMGVKIGRETVYWVAQSATFLPDLTCMGRYGFLGGVAMLGTSVVHNGRIVFNKIHCGDNFVIAQQGYVPPGCRMGDGAVLGAGAYPHARTELPEGSVWFGTPAMQLSVPPYTSNHPSLWMLTVHGLFVVLQTTIQKLFDTQVPAYININVVRLLHSSLPLWSYPFILASIWVSSVLYVAVFVLIWKWVICGTFKPCEHDMYSVWCFKRDLTVALRRWPEAQIVSLFKGTPWCLYWYRLLGAKVGKNVYMETLTMEETDLHTVGDGAVILDGAGLDSHTVEGRTWKIDDIKVGRGAIIETNAIILKGASLADGAQVGALSTTMANEEVTNGRWLGAPVTADTSSVHSNALGA